MKEIKLSQGKVALVDAADFEYLNQWKWSYSCGYAQRADEAGKKVYMHRQLLNCPAELFVDHVNRNKTDNRRCNLRIATRAQNTYNAKVPRHNTSGLIGVNWDKAKNKWRAYCSVNNKSITIGRFTCKQTAIEARDAYIKNLRGEYARLNNE